MLAVTRENVRTADQVSGRSKSFQSVCSPWRVRLRCSVVALALLGLLFVGGAELLGAQAFSVVHSFNGSPDGASPSAGLIRDSAGNLYGTTTFGGVSGNGAVFKLNSAGNETVLYSFTGGSDGAIPEAGLVMDSSGNLYGTTAYGGASGNGVVFRVDPAGNENVLYSFTGGSDGATPEAGLVMDSSGNLYGTTLFGGSAQSGTVFKLDPAGNETVLHSFTGGNDGAYPFAGLIRDSAGNLYGTTNEGGSSDCSGGCGTVFKLDPSGNETVLHSFAYYSDGGYPYAGLVIDASGNLYGTAYEGGPSGYGTVFRLDPSGNETVLHNFTYSDGAYPVAGLVRDSSGNLYGTATSGGAGSPAVGVVFELDRFGNETVLHTFTGGSDGADPYAGVVQDSSRNLYGTAEYGGSSSDCYGGCGTAFKVTLPVPFSAFSAKLDITTGPPPGFQLAADFTQGSGASGIDPVTQNFTLNVGSYSVTIPAGAFQKAGTGLWIYDGTIGGATLQIRISQTGANSYRVLVDASGPDLTNATNPVAVTLTIGQNSGTTEVKADF